MTHLVVWSIIVFWPHGMIMDTHSAFSTEATCLQELKKLNKPDAERLACWPVQLNR
jgi:hypothetical protein